MQKSSVGIPGLLWRESKDEKETSQPALGGKSCNRPGLAGKPPEKIHSPPPAASLSLPQDTEVDL